MAPDHETDPSLAGNFRDATDRLLPLFGKASSPSREREKGSARLIAQLAAQKR